MAIFNAEFILWKKSIWDMFDILKMSFQKPILEEKSISTMMTALYYISM